MQPSEPTFTLTLPRHYDAGEVLLFHARDSLGLAERTRPNGLRKGFLLGGVPVVLDLSWHEGLLQGRLEADGPLSSEARASLPRIMRHLLGLSIDPEPFETETADDRWLGPLVRRQKGLRIPQTASAFEALTWAILGQQITLSFAITLRQTFIRLAGRQHSSGLWCYPDAASVAQLDPGELGLHKFSRAKAQTLVLVARLALSGALPLDQWQEGAPGEIESTLLAIKGIGPWTVNYALLRGYGWGDCSLHGDAGIRIALQRLTGGGTRAAAGDIKTFLERYQPHRSLAAAHLWASLRAPVSL